MSYTPNIPISGDSLGGTRDRIRSNFQLIKSVIGQEHWTFGETDQGLHKRVVMPEATTSGSGIPGTNANAAGLYVNPGTNPAEANLWIRGESDGFKYQLTTLDSTKTAEFATTAGTNSSGWTFLPGNMILQYGIRTLASKGNTTTITFPKSFLTAVYSITIGNITDEGNNPDANNQYIKEGTVSKTEFKMVNSSGSSTRKVYWMAIGK